MHRDFPQSPGDSNAHSSGTLNRITGEVLRSPTTCRGRTHPVVMLSDLNQPRLPGPLGLQLLHMELTWISLSPFVLLLFYDMVRLFAYLTTGLKSHLGPAGLFPSWRG